MDLSQRVQHPNLARTLDVGHEGDIYFMVLEYIPGESLYQIVKRPAGRPAPRPRHRPALPQGRSTASSAAHDAGLIHRDIKPSNMMITPDGDAKILDLGLARMLGDEESR